MPSRSTAPSTGARSRDARSRPPNTRSSNPSRRPRRDALAARLWCRKEAVAKATGLGLALELTGWAAEDTGDAPWFAAALTELPEPVLVCDLDAVDRARAAVAVAGASKPPAVTVREARPG